MTKAETIKQVADDAGVTQVVAEKMYDSLVAAIVNTVKAGNKIRIVGLGTFEMTQRKARTGRNPQTGAEIVIAAKKAVTFSATKELRDLK